MYKQTQNDTNKIAKKKWSIFKTMIEGSKYTVHSVSISKYRFRYVKIKLNSIKNDSKQRIFLNISFTPGYP